MKLEIDPALFWFELKALLRNKLTLGQTLLMHWYFIRVFFGKAAPASCDAVFWTNYGLLICTAVSALMGAVCVGYVLVKPRANGMVELLLASPLSLRKFIGTSLAVCVLFSAANLAVHLAVLVLRFGSFPYGAGFYAALAASLAFTVLITLAAVIFSLRSRDANQLHAVLMMVGMLFWAVAFVTGLRLSVPLWAPLAAVSALLAGAAGLWRLFPRLITKEKAVLA